MSSWFDDGENFYGHMGDVNIMAKVVFMTRGEGQKTECLIFLGIGIGLMGDCFGFRKLRSSFCRR